MQRLGMFTGCNSWLNKEGIFGRPCGMGHCFAERWNEIRALTLHQTLFALHDWKGPGWQHKAALLQTPPCNTITSSIASQLLNHLYWLCLTTAQSCPASQGHDAPCKHRMEPWHHFQRASRTVIPAEMDILVFVYIDSLISTVCLPFRENLKLHFRRQISTYIDWQNISKCRVMTTIHEEVPGFICLWAWMFGVLITKSQMWSCLGSKFDTHTNTLFF